MRGKVPVCKIVATYWEKGKKRPRLVSPPSSVMTAQDLPEGLAADRGPN